MMTPPVFPDRSKCTGSNMPMRTPRTTSKESESLILTPSILEMHPQMPKMKSSI
jgi:hypothetical protein